METTRKWWWRIAGPSLLMACVYASALHGHAGEAVSVHECCPVRYEESEPAVSSPPVPQNESRTPSSRFFAFGFVSFLLGGVVGWLIKKKPDKTSILDEVNKKIENRIAEAKLHKSNLGPDLLGKAGNDIRTYLNTALG